ncbi:unnamed protein product [Closterium sp. NIES-53]
MTTLRVLLHVAAQRDYELHSLDLITAFLQGSQHEGIWLRRPPGFTESFPAGTQWSLWRPVYGLRQVPREWHDTLRTTLAAPGFAPSTSDPSLFLRTDTSLPPFYVLVYVDDLVFATADTEALTLGKSELQKRHTCTDLCELCNYLGLQITRDRAQRTITLTQSHMVHQSVEPSGPYPELVGCFMHLMTCTRPDLAYPLSLLARYVAPGRHRKVHWDAAKRVLRYLCSTSSMGLVLGGRGPVVLTSHADASWVDDSAMQRSSKGYTFSLGSGSVSWWSTRSSSVLISSCEAEIYTGAMAAQELRWLTYLLTDLGEQPRSPPVLQKYFWMKNPPKGSSGSEYNSLVRTPPAFTDAALSLLIPFVCRRWRRLSQRYVSTPLVRKNLAVSRQDLANAVSCFPNLTHLHMCNGSVETLDDAFLSHLSSSCPKLSVLHTGSKITGDPENDDMKHLHLVTKADLRFLESLQIEGEGFYFSRFFPLNLPCARLGRLVIANCNVKRLPDDLGEILPCLHELMLRRCYELTRLPEDFTSLTRLESLTVSSCLRFSNMPHNFGHLPALKSLVLRMLALTNLPDSIGHLESLEWITMYRLPIRELPESFPYLTSLKSLIMVACCEIQQLPANFGRLGALKMLCMVKQPKLKLPVGLGGMDAIQRIDQGEVFNSLQLPYSLTQLTSLTRLDLNFISDEKLPEGIGKLNRLHQLHIQCCFDLRGVPDSVTGLTNLDTLTIGLCSQLVSLLKNLDALFKLKRLGIIRCHPAVWLNGPRISLPSSLESLSLRSYNHTMHLPDLPVLPNLKKLTLNLVSVEGGEAGFQLVSIRSYPGKPAYLSL